MMILNRLLAFFCFFYFFAGLQSRSLAAPLGDTPAGLLRGRAAPASTAKSETTQDQDQAQQQQQQQQRKVQWLLDQNCYDNGGNVIICSELQGRCNNVKVCAATPQDADQLGRFFCINYAYTVWNNEESDCAWQYMCCNNP